MSSASSVCRYKASVNGLVPFVHVADVQDSLSFYSSLGFTRGNAWKDKHGNRFWALAQSPAAEMMLAQASGPIDAEQQAALFYMYSPDLSTLRATLIEHGLRDAAVYRGVRDPDDTTQQIHELAHPSHMKGGELRVIDPGDYAILIGPLS